METGRDDLAAEWIAFAALSNALFGTSRQIAWLGVLVMVPSTIWICRRRRYAVPVGAAAWVISVGVVFASMHWFNHQPYSVPEHVMPGRMTIHNFRRLTHQYAHAAFGLLFFLLPALVAFPAALALRTKRARVAFAASLVAVLACALFMFYGHRFEAWILPNNPDVVSKSGLVNWSPIRGERPTALNLGVRVVATACTLLSALCCLIALLLDRRPDSELSTSPASKDDFQRPVNGPTMKVLLILILPFALAYIALLGPRGSFDQIFDRYLLPLLFVGLTLLARVFQERVRLQLPFASAIVTILFGGFAVAGTHDCFSFYRARKAAIDELLGAGVPATSIEAGYDYDGLVQIEKYGTLFDPRIQVPAHLPAVPVDSFPPDCEVEKAESVPAIKPGFGLSFDPDACGGVAGFAPVTYSTWLPPNQRTSIYIVHTDERSGREIERTAKAERAK